uniref:Ig-like domain-containing protein n=1 Tax=Salvator merianae TaxID=96440 RepID=A0A8D0BDL3_SALMN
ISPTLLPFLPSIFPLFPPFFLSCFTRGDSVSQAEGPVFIQEGQQVELFCSYETSFTGPGLFWYEQQPLQPPQLLLTQFDAEDDESKERQRWFSVKKEQKFFNLTKASVELRDSAVYFCAMSDTVRQLRRCAGQKPTQWLSVM